MPFRTAPLSEYYYTTPSPVRVIARPLDAERPVPHAVPRYRVLIADDDPLIVNLLLEQVEILGMEPVGAAGNGAEAVRLAEALHPDLVLLDVKMPVLDGIAAADQIAVRCPVPVLIVTAYFEGLAETVNPTRVHGLLGKPWRLAQLERAIPDAVARFRRTGARSGNGIRG